MGVRDFPPPPDITSPDFPEWLEKVRKRLCIDDLQTITTVAASDEVAVFDVSGNVVGKSTITGLGGGTTILEVQVFS